MVEVALLILFGGVLIDAGSTFWKAIGWLLLTVAAFIVLAEVSEEPEKQESLVVPTIPVCEVLETECNRASRDRILRCEYAREAMRDWYVRQGYTETVPADR